MARKVNTGTVKRSKAEHLAYFKEKCEANGDPFGPERRRREEKAILRRLWNLGKKEIVRVGEKRSILTLPIRRAR